jgi:hypothetical protein
VCVDRLGLCDRTKPNDESLAVWGMAGQAGKMHQCQAVKWWLECAPVGDG